MSAIDELISRLKETYREVRVLDGRDNAVRTETIRNCLAMANEAQRNAPAEEARSFVLKEQRDTARHSLREARAEIKRLTELMSEPFACARQAEGGYVCQSDLDLDESRAALRGARFYVEQAAERNYRVGPMRDFRAIEVAAAIEAILSK